MSFNQGSRPDAEEEQHEKQGPVKDDDEEAADPVEAAEMGQRMAELGIQTIDSSSRMMSKKLVTVSKSGIILIDQSTTKDLAGFQSSSEVKFFCVLGPARTGKSFLLNCLTGKVGGFTVSNEDTVTKGVDIFMSPVKLSNNQSTNYYFLDVEGMGDNTENADYRLCLPVAASVDVIIFNIRGQPGRSDLLNLLGRFVFMHKKVFPESSAGFRIQSKLFPHLVLVFRDWTFNKEHGAKYWKQSFEPEVNEDGQSSNVRNAIRKTLNSCFQSIDALFFPLPAEQKTIASTTELPPENISKEFSDKIFELKQLIERKVRDKTESIVFERRFNPIETFVKTLDLLANAVNESAFHLPSVLDALKEYYIGQLESAMKLWTESNHPPKLPVHPDDLVPSLNNRLKAIEMAYDEKVEGMEVDSRHRQIFILQIQKVHEEQLINNDRIIEGICNNACTEFIISRMNRNVTQSWSVDFNETLQKRLEARGVRLRNGEASRTCGNIRMKYIADCFLKVEEAESKAREQEEIRKVDDREKQNALRRAAEEKEKGEILKHEMNIRAEEDSERRMKVEREKDEALRREAEEKEKRTKIEEKMSQQTRDYEERRNKMEREKEDWLRLLQDEVQKREKLEAEMSSRGPASVRKPGDNIVPMTEKVKGIPKRNAASRNVQPFKPPSIAEKPMILDCGVQLLQDAGPGQSRRFLTSVTPDLAKRIYSAELPQDMKVAVISVAGLDRPGHTWFILVLLRYLEYRSAVYENGDEPSDEGFFSFVKEHGTKHMERLQSMVGSRGLHMWLRPFRLVADVAVFLMCAVGAFPSELDAGGASVVLSASVVGSSVQLVHVGGEIGSLHAHDCLRTIMTSTDFLIYSNKSMAKQMFPRLWFLISNEDTVAANNATISNVSQSMLTRAETAIQHNQVDMFIAGALPTGKYERVRCPWISANGDGAVVDDLQVDTLASSSLLDMFHLFERVLGREGAAPPLKIGFSGQPVTLGEFTGFIGQVCLVAGRNELISEWSKCAVQAWTTKLCGEQVTDWKDFNERYSAACVSAFSKHPKLQKMMDCHFAHSDEWNRLDSRYGELKKFWDDFDASSCDISYSEQRKNLVDQMNFKLNEIKETDVSVKNVRCQWERRYHLIRGECYTAIRRSVAILLDKIGNGIFASTRQYIEERNSLLDISKLLNSCLTSFPTDLCLLPQYRDLQHYIVGDILGRVIYTTDAAWSARNCGTFNQISVCTQNALSRFESKFLVLLEEMATGQLYVAELNRKLDTKTNRVMDKWIKKAYAKEKSGGGDELDYILCDQKSLLSDMILWWVTRCRVFSQDGLTGRCWELQSNKMDALRKTVMFHLQIVDQLSYCLRCIPVE